MTSSNKSPTTYC